MVSDGLPDQVTERVVHMVVRSAASAHLQEGASAREPLLWLLSVQLMHGAMRCLRLLWPHQAASSTSAVAGALRPPPHPDETPITLEQLLPGDDYTKVELLRQQLGLKADVKAVEVVERSVQELGLESLVQELGFESKSKGDKVALLGAKTDACLRTLGISAALLPLLAAQLCGTERLLQSAASSLLAHIVANGTLDTLPAALAALTKTLRDLHPAALARRQEALQQVAPLLREWLAVPRMFRHLARHRCIDDMQALALILLAEQCPKLRGEAAQLLALVAPVARVPAPVADSAAPAPAGAPTASAAFRAVGASSAVTSACLVDVLVQKLPAIAERALSDPLQLHLWIGFGASSPPMVRQSSAAAAQLRDAAARADLRAFVEACGSSEGDQELWLCCLHGIVHTLVAGGQHKGEGCALALRAAWPMIMQRMQSMVGGVRAALASGTHLPSSWAPYASLASGCALAVLGHDDAGDACRSDVERLLRDGVSLLVCDSEAHRVVASAVLGQLRGGAAVQLVLSVLAPELNDASIWSDWRRDAKNVASPIHMKMRQLGHVLALLSDQRGWCTLLTTQVGAPLAALARWMHGALEYLALKSPDGSMGNQHAWLLQRARKHFFDLLSRTTPHLLTTLAAADAQHRTQR